MQSVPQWCLRWFAGRFRYQRAGWHRHEGKQIARSSVDPQLINYVTVGTTMPTDSRYAYASCVASIQAGLSMESVAMQVSRLCALASRAS